MRNALKNMNAKMKETTKSAFIYSIKIFSGAVLGLTLSLIGQRIFGYGTFSFIFVILVCVGLFLMKAKRWNLVPVLVFDLVCVLVGLLLRMYILVAPGA